MIDRYVAAAAVAAALLTVPVAAQTSEKIDADRPHVGTGTHIVPPGEVQFELGGQYQSFSAERTYGSPTLVRIGISDAVEARVSTDGYVARSAGGSTASDLGNLQVGAKFRLAGTGDEPWLSVMPTISIGLASEAKGLGTGSTDASVTLLTGRAVTDRAHVEANYGIGSVGDVDGSRFAQHLVTAAITHETTAALTTYVEGAWWSRQSADGIPVSFIDYGGIYALTPRVLVDAGAFTGLTRATADYGLFAGLSFVIGDRARPSTHQRLMRSSTR